MAEESNTTRRAFLSGLAATPVLAVPIAASEHVPTIADLMSALRSQLDAQGFDTWSVSLTRTETGFHASAGYFADERTFRPMVSTGDIR